MIVHSLLVWLGLLTLATGIVTYFESEKIKHDVYISKGSKRSRSIIFFMCNMFIGILIDVNFNLDIKDTVLLVLLYHTIYWTEFDIFLNVHRKKSILYVSDNDRDDSDVWTDKIFHIFGKRYSGVVQMIVKVGLIIGLSYMI